MMILWLNDQISSVFDIFCLFDFFCLRYISLSFLTGVFCLCLQIVEVKVIQGYKNQ